MLTIFCLPTGGQKKIRGRKERSLCPQETTEVIFIPAKLKTLNNEINGGFHTFVMPLRS